MYTHAHTRACVCARTQTHISEHTKRCPLQRRTCAAGPVAHRCRVARSRLAEVFAGEPTSFELHVRTSSDEPVGVADLAHLSVGVYAKGKQLSSGFVQRTSECGVYHCTFTVVEVGSISVGVHLRGKDVSGSPFPLAVVAAAICPSRCRASGVGILQTAPGMLTSFTVKCFDVHGNMRRSAGGEDVRIEFCRAGEDVPDPLIAEVSGPRWLDGTGGYVFQYVVRKPGKLRMFVSIDGEPVANSPFLVHVSTAASTAPAALLLHRPSYSHEAAAVKHTNRASAGAQNLPAARSQSSDRLPRKAAAARRVDSQSNTLARSSSAERLRTGTAVRAQDEAGRRVGTLAVAHERAASPLLPRGSGIERPKPLSPAPSPPARVGSNRRGVQRYLRHGRHGQCCVLSATGPARALMHGTGRKRWRSPSRSLRRGELQGLRMSVTAKCRRLPSACMTGTRAF
jgi:hypothetical protein